MTPLSVRTWLLAGLGLLAMTSTASAQLAPQPPVGNASTEGNRYEDILKAQRCMEFMGTVSSGSKLKDLKRQNADLDRRIRQDPRRAAMYRQQKHPQDVIDALGTRFGRMGSFRNKRYVSLPPNPGKRPDGWDVDDMMGSNTSDFRVEIYRRYGTPRNAPRGTYNLSFVILSDADDVFVCIQGTEPTVFPSPNPTGNTMNNLKASPVVLRKFDRKATVHQGWAEVAHHYHKLLAPILKRHGLAQKKLSITGHSQGAVMAGYIAFLLAKNKDLPRSKRHRDRKSVV